MVGKGLKQFSPLLFTGRKASHVCMSERTGCLRSLSFVFIPESPPLLLQILTGSERGLIDIQYFKFYVYIMLHIFLDSSRIRGASFGWTLINADFQTLIFADNLRSSALRGICGYPRAISVHFISGLQVPEGKY